MAQGDCCFVLVMENIVVENAKFGLFCWNILLQINKLIMAVVTSFLLHFTKVQRAFAVAGSSFD